MLALLFARQPTAQLRCVAVTFHRNQRVEAAEHYGICRRHIWLILSCTISITHCMVTAPVH